jgi:hypothetical protein
MSWLVLLLVLLAIPTVIGILIVHNTLGVLPRWGWLGKASLGIGLGLGLCGVLTFASLVLTSRVTLVFEVMLLALVMVWTLKRRELPSTPVAREVWSPPTRALLAVALLPLTICLVALAIQLPQHEYGGWDAWDFWNMRARYFARGGEHWWRTFTQINWWSHPEYPVLLPAMVARGFGIVGGEPASVPMTIAAVFTLATVVLLFFGVAILRGTTQGLLAALMLLVTPFFLFHGSAQYADVPLSFFFLATFVALAVHDHLASGKGALLALAGCFAGLASFTKNEGMLFLACLVIARLGLVWRTRGRRELTRQAAWFCAGAAPMVAVVVFFKAVYSVMPDNAEFYAGRWQDWNHSVTQHVWMQLTRGQRYVGFFESWWANLTSFDERPVPIFYVLVAYALLVGLESQRPRRVLHTLWLTLLLQLIGVSALFLWWSTYEIHEHMDATNRLLLQALPTVLFGLFCALRTPWSVVIEPAPKPVEQ